MEIELKYGCNPQQLPARLIVPDQAHFRVLNGKPSYINILDALGAWQLARELKRATGKPGAASFKHTSPAGAAVAGYLSDAYRISQFLVDEELTPVASAYVRARGGDRMCSFGDVAAVSEVVDMSLARVLKREVSDLIIAPGFDPAALEVLKAKKDGTYLIFQIAPDYEPPEIEMRELFGFSLQQKRNTAQVSPDLFRNAVTGKTFIPTDVMETLIVATIAIKYTQSNSVWNDNVSYRVTVVFALKIMKNKTFQQTHSPNTRTLRRWCAALTAAPIIFSSVSVLSFAIGLGKFHQIRQMRLNIM